MGKGGITGEFEVDFERTTLEGRRRDSSGAARWRRPRPEGTNSDDPSRSVNCRCVDLDTPQRVLRLVRRDDCRSAIAWCIEHARQ